ncbi:phospholipase A-2-activating protein [Crepidotus variabilis]|uniref:Phospholipase A-2-activating protein n=1 Tax=Crepidotus variabilis TaxID=179855 RepID=A0A9P6JTQ0_9AGAR|nr:phospholipase A-2-activating protein [Crepidotus variabilis]
MPYKLSATLKAHTQDVRAVSSPTDTLILSASRDSTAISWQRSSPSDNDFKPDNVLKAGSRFVNAVTYIRPTPEGPKGYAVTGGQDAVVNIFDLQNPRDEPDFCLIGHSENICTLDVTPGGTIISGSWDKTAKVWKNYNLVYDLKGHQQSVWAVLGLDEDQFLTGSADKTIKLWQQHKVLHTYSGHQDAVRGLAKLPDIGFASCSNDSEIRVWTLGGDLVYTLSGHTSFVYSLSVLPNGDVVSAGEDRTVRVWKDGEISQTIVHPAISVWAVSTMPNGDIVSGCSDGIVRVFSESESRWASPEVLKEYDERLASQALPSQQVGDINKEQLAGAEALNVPGKKDGEVKMIRNGSIVEAHTWDGINQQWQKVGEVVDAVGTGRKQLYQGKEYDYVFDVDIQDGVPPLKLPYNAAENPYVAAQRFLQSNELPLTYLDEVVKFIEKNTAGVSLGGGGEDYVDPFTGASRYRSNPAPSSGAGQYADPFTGASRYVSPGSTPQPAGSSQYSDPFTGASRYTGTPSGSPPPVPAPTNSAKILPVIKVVTFNQANILAMRTKLLQLDEAFRHEISTSTIAMYPEEATLVEEIFTYLTQVTSTPDKTPSGPLTAAHIDAISAILERWPLSQRFPIIDLSRLVLGFCPETFQASPGLKDRFTEALFRGAELIVWTSAMNKVKETNTTLALKAVANAFNDKENSEISWLTKVVGSLGQVPYGLLTKAQKVALASVLFNISCEGLRHPIDGSLREQLVTIVNAILAEEKTETEAVYRVLVALGNIAAAANAVGALSGAQVATVKQTFTTLPARFPDARVRSICNEISGLI